MLTAEEIKKELDAGNTVDLECIDKNGLLGAVDPKYNYNKLILESSLQVSRYFIDGAGLLVLVIEPGLMMTEEELQCFRIKRPTPTFDDLIDIAVKAKKDKLLSRVEIKDNSLNATVSLTDSKIAEFCTGKMAGDIDIKERIDWINSLYTETFVIEHASDMERIKRTAIIVLENGCEVCAESDCLHHGVNYIQTTYGGMNFNLSFVSLKGATVTQKRGVA